MIRSVSNTAEFSYRRRLGDASGLAAFNPLIGAGVSLATSAVGMWMNSIQVSHNADTATTLIVNGLAQQLQNLLNAYMAEKNVTCGDQRAALDAYDNAWAWLQGPQACGAPNYGSAGNRCISDRAPNGKYPWQSYFRDPIANDPRLAGQCDTGQAVILPSITTGTYSNTGITSTGGDATSGQTAAQIAAAAVAAAVNPPAGAVPSGYAAAPAATLQPNYLLWGAGALALFLVAKAL